MGFFIRGTAYIFFVAKQFLGAGRSAFTTRNPFGATLWETKLLEVSILGGILGL